MAQTVLVYEGFSLEAVRGGYQSVIDGRIRQFDTPSMWVQYINLITNKSNGKTE